MPQDESHSDGGIPPETIDEICAELYAGQKIAAIKLYREATGKGLKESKEFVEALERRLRDESPEKFTAPSGSGCAGVLLILMLAGGTMAVAAEQPARLALNLLELFD